MNKLKAFLPDSDATFRFGTALAEAIVPDDGAIITLSGPLGAGKTALVQAVAHGLGVREIVNSPTFTMLNEYHSGQLPLYHMDLYRLSEADGRAATDLLLCEMDEFIHTRMVAMIEWAELLQQQDAAGSDLVQALDHLMIELSFATVRQAADKPAAGTQEATRPLINACAPGATFARAQDRGSDESVPEKHINKDEEGRLACLLACGQRSAALLNRLCGSIADMLIYS